MGSRAIAVPALADILARNHDPCGLWGGLAAHSMSSLLGLLPHLATDILSPVGPVLWTGR